MRRLLDRRLAVLGLLAAVAAAIAQALPRQLAAGGYLAFKGGIASAFEGVSRAARMIVALRSKLSTDHETARDAKTRAQAADANALRSAPHQAETLLAHILAPGDLAAHEDDDEEDGDDDEDFERLDVERLDVEGPERAERDDVYRKVMSRPVGEIIQQICRDLGLSSDWLSLIEQAWSQDSIDSDAGASALAALQAKAASFQPTALPPPTIPPRQAPPREPDPRPPHAASP